MVTVIHVVDILEPIQSLPPRSLSPPLSGLPVCLLGSLCSQLLQKKQPVIVTGNADAQKPHSPPPPPLLHHRFNYTLSHQTFVS